MMSWSQEFTIDFIKIYRKFDILWNPRHPNHFNKLKKQDAWEEIANEIGKTVEECKKKMDYLLTALRREKMKIKRSCGPGKSANDVYKSSWFALDSMKFLWEKKNAVSSTNSVFKAQNAYEETFSDVSHNGERSINQEASNLETLSGNPNRSSSPKAKLLTKKNKKSSVERKCPEASSNILDNSTKEEDDSFHFGNLVASKLRVYDESTRCGIQSDIMKIFCRANSGYYSKSFYSYANFPSYSDCNSSPSQRETDNQSPNEIHDDLSP